MSRVRKLTLLIILSFSLISFAKETSLKTVEATLQKYKTRIKNKKTVALKVKEVEKLKEYIFKLKTKSTREKYKYYLSLKEAFASIKTVKVSTRICSAHRDGILFVFGFPPKTSYKKTSRPVRHALETLKALCPNMSI